MLDFITEMIGEAAHTWLATKHIGPAVIVTTSVVLFLCLGVAMWCR